MVSGGVGGERVTTKIEFSLQFVAYSLLLQIEWERKNLPICSQLCEAGFGSCTKAILQRRINLLKGKNKPPEAGNFLLVSCITTPPQTAVLPELQQWGVRGCPHILRVCVWPLKLDDIIYTAFVMGTRFWVKWGPNGDPWQQKWGPKKHIYEELTWNERIRWKKYISF